MGKHFIEVTNGQGKRESIKHDVSGFAINLIGDGAFAKMFPFEIKNIQGLVNKYDEVEGVISQWPNVDKKKYLEDENGNEYNYYTIKIDQ